MGCFYVKPSRAESPPPITASGLLRNIGTAPSHTAHAEMPFCQNSSSPAPINLKSQF